MSTLYILLSRPKLLQPLPLSPTLKPLSVEASDSTLTYTHTSTAHPPRFHKMVFKMERGLLPNRLVPKFRNNVDEYRGLQPVVQVGQRAAAPGSNQV